MTDQPAAADTPDETPEALDPEQARQDPRAAVDALEERVLGGVDRRLEDGSPGDVAPGGDPADTTEDDAGFELDLDPEDQGRADAVGPAPE